ncbi:hypothetical protein [Deefgea piscis]|uniref:hypothetical protein n=1 Tax=Deefgea piscis TaxID=2739061 RepID=UPI001C81EE3F|nr:hypothetical protein [Deefgea piscis]QZA80544.1 hypothetical protein K4H25_13635 [Deefgea piscis]
MKRNLMLAAAFATAFVAVTANAGTSSVETTKYASEFYSGTATNTTLKAGASTFTLATAAGLQALPVGSLINITISEGEWVVPATSTLLKVGTGGTFDNNGVLISNPKTLQFKVATIGDALTGLVLGGGAIKGLKAGSSVNVTWQVTNAAGTSILDSGPATALLSIADNVTTTVTPTTQTAKIDVTSAGTAGTVLTTGGTATAPLLALGQLSIVDGGLLAPDTAAAAVNTKYGALTVSVKGASLSSASEVFTAAANTCATVATALVQDATDKTLWSVPLVAAGTTPFVTPFLCAKFNKSPLAVIAASTPAVTSTIAAVGTAGNSQVAATKTADLYKLNENGASVTMGSYYESSGATDPYSTYTRVQNTGTTDSVIQVSYRGPDGVATAAGALKAGAVLKAGAHVQYSPADIKAAVGAANVKPGYGALTFTAGTASLLVQPLAVNSSTGQVINLAPVEKSVAN